MTSKISIPVSKPMITNEDKAAVQECLDAGWVSGEGPIVSDFEKKLGKIYNRQFAVSCSSGTAALDLVVAALDLGEADHVICPSFTIGSCCFELVKRRVNLTFIDSDLHIFNPSPDDYLREVNEYTKAIIVPHIYGFCVDVPAIREGLNGKGIFIIEDCAESQFLNYPSGGLAGSAGDVSTFSFYSNKTVVAGEGGAVITSDPKIYDRLKLFRNLCFDPDRRFWHKALGWNYRMSSLNAALACSQLDRIEESTNRKAEIGEIYFDKLKSIKEIYIPGPNECGFDNGYWVVPIILKDGGRIGRNKLMKKLSSLGIGTRPFFEPLHLQPAFCENNQIGQLRNAEYLGESGFYLPSFLEISKLEIEYVCRQMAKYFGYT